MHCEDIRAGIRKRYGSMAELCRILNLNTHAIPTAIRQKGYSRSIERKIADALGLPVEKVFPDRYTKNGDPKPNKKVAKLSK